MLSRNHAVSNDPRNAYHCEACDEAIPEDGRRLKVGRLLVCESCWRGDEPGCPTCGNGPDFCVCRASYSETEQPERSRL